MLDAFLPSKDENLFQPVPPENQQDLFSTSYLFQNPLNPGFGEQLKAFDNPVGDLAGDRLWESVLDPNETQVDQTLVDLLTGEALQNFATDPNFTDKISLAFGDNWNRETVRELQQDWLSGDFSDIPEVRILSSDVLTSANGAYSRETDTIYLSRDFLTENAANPAAIADVVLEEYGHAIDAKINAVDAAGDEGDIFSKTVRNKALSGSELLALKVEDDSGVITLEGKTLQIEKDDTPQTAPNLGILTGTRTFNNSLSPTDNYDYYRFSLNSRTPFNLTLNGLQADANVEIGTIGSDGKLRYVANSSNKGTQAESISRTLDPGNYYALVLPSDFRSRTNYNLSLSTGATPPDNAGNNTSFARNIGISNATQTFSDFVGTADTNDYYKFSLNETRQVNFSLNGLQANADLELTQVQNQGSIERVLASAAQSGTQSESISRTLTPGTYYARVYPSGGANTNYNLSVSSSNPSGWVAQYFNNTSLSGNPVSTEYLGDGQNFSRNWGLGSPTNAPSDNFSARMTTRRYLDPGLYKITTQSDDGVRVRIGGQQVIDRWVDQPFMSNSGYFRSNGGTVSMEVDYFERGGGAALNFDIQRVQPFQVAVNETQQWKASIFNWDPRVGSPPSVNFHEGGLSNPNAIGVINLGSNTRSDGKQGISFDLGNGTFNNDGSLLPHDNFAVRAYTWADFDGSPYKFRARGDDGFQILAKQHGTNQWFYITPQNSWEQAYGAHKEYTYTLPKGRYDVHFHQFEGAGNAYLDLSWEKVGGSLSQPTTPVGSSNPFTQSEYFQRLYNNQGSASSWFYNPNRPGHDAIDSTDTYSGNGLGVRALVGGIVVGTPKNGTVLQNVNMSNMGFHPGLGRNVRASDYNAQVEIWNPDINQRFIYIHFAPGSVKLKSGDIVNPGDVIGTEGETGWSIGRHTHLEVRDGKSGGVPRDPLDVLGKARGNGILNKNYK
jgi:murein DD-endopeptidase MepM/ murein hydrolase activator NlpD